MRRFSWLYLLVVGSLCGVTLQAQSASTSSTLEVKNVLAFQRTFLVMKSHRVYDAFDWPGIYEISNHGDQPVSITDMRVLWAPALLEGRQVKLEAKSKAVAAVVFPDQDAVTQSLRKNAEPSASKFPISIPPHAERYLQIHFHLELSDGDKKISFHDESEAYESLSGALGWQKGSDGKFHCLAEDVPLEVSTSDQQILKYQPHTVLLVPGCVMNAPRSMPVAKGEWKRYSFSKAIDFSSPSVPTFLTPDHKSPAVQLGSTYVVFAKEVMKQKPSDPDVQAKTYLQAATSNFTRARNYKISSARDVTVDGNPGIEFEAANEKYHCKVLFLVVRSELISVEAIGPVAEPAPIDVDKLINSIRVLQVESQGGE